MRSTASLNLEFEAPLSLGGLHPGRPDYRALPGGLHSRRGPASVGNPGGDGDRAAVLIARRSGFQIEGDARWLLTSAESIADVRSGDAVAYASRLPVSVSLEPETRVPNLFVCKVKARVRLEEGPAKPTE